MKEVDILLDNFSRGKRDLPIKGSFWASVGLNPFIKKGKLTSEYYLRNEANSTTLTSLGSVDDFSKTNISGVSQTLMVKTGASFYKEVSGVWSGTHSCTLAHTAGHLGMVVSPHNGYLHWCSNEAVGKFDGTVWTDTWKSGLTNIYHYMLSIRNKVLISNGQYIAGWSAANGSDWSTAMLDLSPGYNSKRIVMRKSAGTRQALIQGQYDSDRTKDGIFIWDTTSTTPVDFIPVPYMQDLWVENDIVYVIHGNQLDISEVVGTQLKYLNSVFDKVVLMATTANSLSASFLGKFSSLLLIAINGTRETGVTGDNFYPGLWAYNIDNNALFFWLPPSDGNIYKVSIGGVYIQQSTNIGQDLWVASKTEDGTAIKYYIDKVTKIISGDFIHREIYVSPTLTDGSIATKVWKKIKSMHNRLLTTARILFKYRDFSRDLVSIQQTITAVSASTFQITTAATINVEVGDEVTVIAGTGAGQVRHIIGVTTAETPNVKYTYTIDENWDTNPVVNYSIVEIASWKKMSETSAITNKEKDSRELTFIQRGITNQVKLVLEHPKSQSIDLEMLEIKGEE